MDEDAPRAVDARGGGKARGGGLLPLGVVDPERGLRECPGVLRRAGEHRDVDGANRRRDGAGDAHARVARVPRAVDERGRGDTGERHGVARFERLERFADAGRERCRSNRRIGDAVGKSGEVALEAARAHHVVRNDVGEHIGEGGLPAVGLRLHGVELAQAQPTIRLVDGVGRCEPMGVRLAARRIGRGRDGHIAPLDRCERLAQRQCDEGGIGNQRVNGRGHGMVSPCWGCARRRTVLLPDFAVGTW